MHSGAVSESGLILIAHNLKNYHLEAAYRKRMET